MFTKIKLLLILLCLSISAVAETHYNSVHSVTLNNTDLTNSISMAKAVSLIKGRGIEKKAVFSECTVNYDMEIRFPGKKLRLEFFPEENPSVDLQKIF